MRTFRRLLGFLRPHRRAVIGSLVFAWLAMSRTPAGARILTGAGARTAPVTGTSRR